MNALLAAVASGLLFGMALPPQNWEPLGWVALAPLLLAAARRTPLEAAGLGLLSAGVCAGLRVGWSRDTDALFWAYLPFLWLMLLLALACAAGTLARRRGSGLPWALLIACVGTAGEWLTTFLPLPLNIALCQYQNLPLIQMASVTGIWGVSFLLWLVNAAVADGFLQRRPSASAVCAAALLLLSVGYGRVALQREPREPSLRVAAIQDDTGDETEGLAPPPAPGAPLVDREAMTRQAAAQGARLAVWSEECLGAAFLPGDPQDRTRRLAETLHTALVVGYSDDARPKSHNCAAWIEPDGAVRGIHHKVHLYLGESQSVQRGGQSHAFNAAFGRVGMEVCFDSCYTDITRQITQGGARLIAMPNYDPPTPRGVLHELHGAMLPFRAVENRVAFVRADSNGLSQVIAPDGRIVAQGPLYAPAVVMGNVPLGDGRGTFFTRAGDWFAYACLTALLGCVAFTCRFRHAWCGGSSAP